MKTEFALAWDSIKQIKYVIVDGYHDIQSYGSPLHILTINSREIQNKLRLIPDDSIRCSMKTRTDFIMNIESEPKITRKIKLFETAKGVYPPQLESSLLSQRVLKEGLFYIPSLEIEFWLVLYHAIIRRGELPAQERDVIINRLNQRFGQPQKCKYPQIPSFTSPKVHQSQKEEDRSSLSVT